MAWTSWVGSRPHDDGRHCSETREATIKDCHPGRSEAPLTVQSRGVRWEKKLGVIGGACGEAGHFGPKALARFVFWG